jgi:hypothetical protein
VKVKISDDRAEQSLDASFIWRHTMPHESHSPRPLVVRRRVAASMIGGGTTKLHELIASGEIEARKSGRSLLISVASLEAYIAGLPVEKLNSCYKKPTAPEAA